MFKGQILLWSGSVATIPDGWALCNGTNGTPNLVDKFIQGGGGLAPIGSNDAAPKHQHDFEGDGHWHAMSAGGDIAGGSGFDTVTDTRKESGITDLAGSRPPYYVLAYIMKLYDDVDPRTYLPWPYAAKAIVQHSWLATVLKIYVTFRHPMNTDNKPADNLWTVEADGSDEPIDSSEWIDAWTMLLTIDPLAAEPDEVTLEYEGPDENLSTTWNKQWEPWGPILSSVI